MVTSIARQKLMSCSLIEFCGFNGRTNKFNQKNYQFNRKKFREFRPIKLADLRIDFYSNSKRTMFFYENLYLIKVIPSMRKHAYGDADCAASDAFPVIFLRKTTGATYFTFLLFSTKPLDGSLLV